ncbi:MAG TPA: urea ABC transporter ATP-binding subunit UrtE [Armatimonadota bacterium]|nr:urea ABC transporter ATP-binding subunit UrtE [Armatimonadota bacterium]
MLQVDSLCVNYGESRILHDVSISVSAGQVACLMGRNGMGKTTLLKGIMGVLKARTGGVFFEGKELTHQSPAQRARAGIGYVPQGRGIFPYLSVHENLLMGLEAASGPRQSEVLDEMYVLFPVLWEMRRRTAGALSGGQQQQLAIARALVRRPRLLILDEPTEGIQPSIMHLIENTIQGLARRGDMSILLVEQFLDFALRVAHHYHIMETGVIVAQGAISEFDVRAVSQYLTV